MSQGYNPEIHRRRSVRLRGYDYTREGAYFVTICTHNRIPLFGEISEHEIRLNDAGRIAYRLWEQIPEHFDDVDTDEFIVMPNHIHGIIVITGSDVGATHASPLRGASQSSKASLGTIVGSYKSAVSKRLNQYRGTHTTPVWQRNYYEHVIRNEAALHDIRYYIIYNPAKWADDPDNPKNAPQRSGQRRYDPWVAPTERTRQRPRRRL